MSLKTKYLQTPIQSMAMITILRGLLLGLGAFCGTSNAQLSEADTTDAAIDIEDMYRVEMIVFKRGNYYDDQYANSEIWPKTIDLYYPESIKSLLSQEQFNNAIAQYENDATLYDLNVEDIAQRVRDNSTVTHPINQRSLRQEARRLMARREMRVLFHEAWDQKLEADAEKVTFAITGGEQYDKHFQLEGSVRIHRTRYLHVKTQFWLSAFEVNQGQELQYWPKLPSLPIPLGPEFNQLPALVTDGSSLANTQTFGNGTANSWSDTQSGSTIKSSAYGSQANTQQANTAGSAEGISAQDIVFEENSPLIPQHVPTYSDDPFIIKNIMTLNQSRRMRSNEIHYIDHPRMGVIIKIMPLEITSTENKDN